MRTLDYDQRRLPHDATPVRGSRTLNVGQIATYLHEERNLLYLRFLDGEFHSMFNTASRRSNADGHHWYIDTMGLELRSVFVWAFAQDDSVLIGMPPCWSEWRGVVDFIDECSDAERARVVNNRTWLEAIQDKSILGFLNAIRLSTAQKVLVSRHGDEPLADAIGATLIACKHPNAYEDINKITDEVKSVIGDSYAVVLSSIGMPSEPLLWRLWKGFGVFLDWGHVPDALMGREVRRYLKRQHTAARLRALFENWRTTCQQ